MPTIETAEESSDPSHSQELDSTSGHHAEENLAPSDHLSISRNPGDVASSSKLLMTQTMHGDAEIPNNRQNIFSKTMPASRSRETVKELSGKPRTISRPSQHSKEDVPELSDQLSISKHPEEITSSKLPMMQTVYVPVKGNADIPDKSQTWHSSSGVLAEMTIPENADDNNEKAEETLSHIREFDRLSKTMPASRSRETIQELSGEPRTISRPKQHSGEDVPEPTDHLSISKHPEEITSSSKLPMMQTVHVPVHGGEDIPNKGQMLQTRHPRSSALSEMPTIGTGEESSDPSHSQELDRPSQHSKEDVPELSDQLSISKHPEEITSSSKLQMRQTVHVPVQGDVDIPNKRQMLQTWHSGSGALAGMTIPEIAEDTNEKTEETLSHTRKFDRLSKTMPASKSGETIKELSGKPRTISRSKTRHPRSSALSEMPTIGTGEESSDPSHSQELDSQTWHSGSGALAGMTIPEIAEDTNEREEETLSHIRELDRRKAMLDKENAERKEESLLKEAGELQQHLKEARQEKAIALEEMKDTLNRNQRESDKLQKNLENARQKEDELKKELVGLENELRDSRNKESNLAARISTLEQECIELREQGERASSELHEKERELEDSRGELQRVQLDLRKQREDITKLEAEKRKSSEKIAQLETDLSDLEIESSKQVQERNRIETEKQDINTELNREKTRLEEKIRLLTDLSKRNEDLTLKIRLLNAEKTTLNQENEDNKRKLLKLEAEKTTLRKEKTKLAQKVKKLEDAKMDANIHLRKASVAKIKEAGYTAYCFVVSMAVVEAGLVIGDSNNCVKCVDVDGDRSIAML
ncbi:hypothetical protein MAR_022002 [Mya arenaria]|uniref:Uncharacterized protein n=1 Tax=Mya arenaria TaxID=6604 RepID=A0ABY7E998_MYAAR|nr:hypothetical protein MAR_022002 [Mya arenaria]